MEQFVIHCPQCKHRLSVPVNSSGRAARCPSCKHVFRVPRGKKIIDESVVAWLDLDRLDSEEEAEERAEIEAEKKAAPANQSHASKPPTPSSDVQDEQPIQAESSGESAEEEDLDKLSLDEIVREAGLTTDSHGSFVAVEIDDDDESDDVPQPRQYKKPEPTKEEKAKSKEPPKPPRIAEKKPTPVMSQIEPTPREPPEPPRKRMEIPSADTTQPKLYVADVGGFGVRFGFDSKLLSLPNFRASMPFKCMATGETDPSRLIAKPLVWQDKNTGKFFSAGEMETRYERKVKAGRTVREITDAMPTLDELPPPFNQPIPYYVVKDQAGKHTVHAESYAMTEGLRCEVVIPFAPYALEWMGRVNGVIGEDYTQLEAEVLKFQAKAWRAIPLQARHRIGIWFDFKGNEEFLGYFNDGDFAKADAGLAGLVITNRRLVWCKYHHHGEVSLDEPQQLLAQAGGAFYDLKLVKGATARKLLHMRLADLKTLESLLKRVEAKIELIIEEN